nr:exodeoxyribonuclease V subunit beta [Desulfobulbaceae bacterium]
SRAETLMTVERLNPVHIPLNGVHLIEASAGTGKTYSITGLYVRLLIEEQLRSEEILVVTYTEAACKELRDAIRSRVSDAFRLCKGRQEGEQDGCINDSFLEELFDNYEKQGKDFSRLSSLLRLAITEFDLSAIYTIHGFCMRVLQDYAFETAFPFETEFVENDSQLLQQIIDDYWLENSPRWHPLFAAYLCHSKWFPDTLITLIAKLLKIVMVAGPEAISFSSRLDPYTIDGVALSRLAELWAAKRQILVDMLESSAALGRAEKSYRIDNLERWFAELDQYFSDDSSLLPPINALNRLSTGALLASARKGKEDSLPRHDFFDLCDQITVNLDAAKNGFLGMLLEHCQRRLHSLKLESGLISFDDLLTGVRDALRRPNTGQKFAAGVGRKYPVALIDEFQDTDPVQYEIFETIYLAGHGQGLFLVGDPKQAIYGFRGADIFAYLAAAKAQVANVHSLTVNWRSEPGLIRACNCLFEKDHLPPFILPDIEFRSAEAPPQQRRILQIDSALSAPMTLAVFAEQPGIDEAREFVSTWLASQIAILLSGSSGNKAQFVEPSADGSVKYTPLAAADIAVLVRSHKEGQIVKTALAAQGVSAVVQARETVFHGQEAREIELLLEAVQEPFNERCLRAALTTSLLGVTAKDLSEMEENEQWDEWLQRFADYNHVWLERGVAPMLYELFNKEKSFVRISKRFDSERQLTNVRHLVELLQQAEHEKGLNPQALIKWMKDNRHDPDQGDASQIRLESDENLVQIVTIHKSKGLQYPVVFCPFLWDSRLTNPKTSDYVVYHNEQGRLSVDFDTADFDDNLLIQQREELAEELRLLYVAVTRAQHRSIINWGRVFSRNKCRTATSALQYLLNDLAGELPKGNNLVKALQSFFESYSAEQWREFLLELPTRSDGCIQLLNISEQPEVFAIKPAQTVELAPAKVFTKNFNYSSGIHSFSSLHSHAGSFEAEAPDHDQNHQVVENRIPPSAETMDMFAFPKGAKAGSCLHAILEKLDFQESAEGVIGELVEEQLSFYGFEQTWGAVVTKFLTEMVRVELECQAGNFSLNMISRKQRLDEMEFHYVLPAASEFKLREIFYNDQHAKQSGSSALESYMKGFIDLLFIWNDQFYIVDYKSNFLGNSHTDYQRDLLKPVMETAGYDLQYRIYTIALHRYLSTRLPGYSYEKHFGGVYYLFLRGMNPQCGTEFGVYFDRPAWTEIEQINAQLLNA